MQILDGPRECVNIHPPPPRSNVFRDSQNPVILAFPMNPLLKIMTHLRTACRGLHSTCPHNQTVTVAAKHTRIN
ncbi:hypothetical protein YC2023_116386 [Brassica napus]